MGSLLVGLPSPPTLLLSDSSCNLKNTDGVGVEDTNLYGTPSYKWRMVIAYDGTHFSGWQYQQSSATIQGIVEKALTRATRLERGELTLVGASRTDKGVHAWGQGPILQLEVEGSGFLYRQVRNMVALLLQIGKEAVPPDIVPMILDSQDRKVLAKYTLSAPPHGLCLMSVKYNEELLEPPSCCPATSFGRHSSISKCKLPFY